MEFTDYTIEIIATAGQDVPTSETAFLPLRVKNPCFDPNLITIESLPLPPGPHSYILFYNDLEDPYWFMTHDAWSYST